MSDDMAGNTSGQICGMNLCDHVDQMNRAELIRAVMQLMDEVYRRSLDLSSQGIFSQGFDTLNSLFTVSAASTPEGLRGARREVKRWANSLAMFYAITRGPYRHPQESFIDAASSTITPRYTYLPSESILNIWAESVSNTSAESASSTLAEYVSITSADDDGDVVDDDDDNDEMMRPTPPRRFQHVPNPNAADPHYAEYLAAVAAATSQMNAPPGPALYMSREVSDRYMSPGNPFGPAGVPPGVVVSFIYPENDAQPSQQPPGQG